jgi:putative aldouronate transport system permease protein
MSSNISIKKKFVYSITSVYRNINRDRFLYLIFSIGFIQIILFKYFPLTWLIMAFKDFKILEGLYNSPWVGLKHFKALFSSPVLWKLLRNTLTINIMSLFLSFPTPIILALLLNELKNAKFKKTVQTISYLPHFLSTVIVVSFITDFLAIKGSLNTVREMIGLEAIFYMAEPKYFRLIYVLSGIWQGVGWGSIIYLAALSSIDVQLYEAAIADGAGKIRQLIHITLPGIAPTITIMLILRIGALINLGFEKIFLLSNTATQSVAQIISTYVYQRGVQKGSYSFATAVGLFNSVISFVMVYSANAISKRLSEHSLW